MTLQGGVKACVCMSCFCRAGRTLKWKYLTWWKCIPGYLNRSQDFGCRFGSYLSRRFLNLMSGWHHPGESTDWENKRSEVKSLSNSVICIRSGQSRSGQQVWEKQESWSQEARQGRVVSEAGRPRKCCWTWQFRCTNLYRKTKGWRFGIQQFSGFRKMKQHIYHW